MSAPIPPFKPPSSSTHGENGPIGKKTGKDFHLPKREKEKKKKEHHEKQQTPFDLIGGNGKQDKLASVQEECSSEQIKSTEGLTPTAQTNIAQLCQLIQQHVSNLRIGQLDGTNFTSLELQDHDDIPSAFVGSQLTLSQQGNDLTIHFDHFLSVQQENSAILLVEQHKEELEQMMRLLSAKNIQVAALSLGSYSVALPRVVPLPPPFQTRPLSQTEAEQQQQQQRQKGEDEPGDQQRRQQR